MIKIIKHGTFRKCICSECGCSFSYEHEDVRNYINPYYSTINCPDCGYEIPLNEKLEIE